MCSKDRSFFSGLVSRPPVAFMRRLASSEEGDGRLAFMSRLTRGAAYGFQVSGDRFEKTVWEAERTAVGTGEES